MEQETDNSFQNHKRKQRHSWHSRKSLEGETRSRRYAVVFVLSLLLLGVLLSCPLGHFALRHSIIKLPCFGRYLSDPFIAPSYYLKLGPPRERQFYDVEFGRSLPVITGVADTHLLLLRFPIDFPHPCFP